MEQHGKKIIDYFLILGILLFTMLRVYNIQRTKPDIDEALFIQLSIADPKHYLDQVIRLTPDPPISYYIANIIHELDLPLLYSMRFLSFFFFIATLILALILLRNHTNIEGYKTFLILLTINPLLTFYSRFAKPYALELIPSLMIIVVIQKLIKEFKRHYLIMFALFNTILFYLSYHTIYFIFLSYIGLAVILFNKDNIKLGIIRFMATLTTMLLLILPWLVTFHYQIKQINECWVPQISQIFKFNLSGTLNDILFFICNGNWFFWPQPLMYVFSFLSFLLISYSIYKIILIRPNKFFIFLLITGVGPLFLTALFTIKNNEYIYYPRMFISSLIPFLIIIAYGLSLSSKSVFRKIILTLTCFLMITSSILIVNNKHPATPKDINHIINIMHKNQGNDTTIIVHPPIISYLIRTYGLENFFSICVDVSNQQGSTCSSFTKPDPSCFDFISKLSNKYKTALLLNNIPISKLMVDIDNKVHKYFDYLYKEKEILYKDSQYELIRYVK